MKRRGGLSMTPPVVRRKVWAAAGLSLLVAAVGGIALHRWQRREPTTAPPGSRRSDRLAEAIDLANRAALGPAAERRAAVQRLKALRREDWDLLVDAGNTGHAASEPAAELVGHLLADEGLPVLDRLAQKL